MRPVRVVAGAVVALFLLNSFLVSEAGSFMGTRLIGPVTVAFAFGLLQCLIAVSAVWWYAQYARTYLDPLAQRLQGVDDGEGGDER